ncbi:hypothetical protein ACHAWU_004502 [Discostella pseudostelligera]|uniref:RxLR effector protein n=1 Tax=Discostella pseudostelligera TaxID=259834 RepID=A0ABD3MSZ6_9STRA
MNSLLFALVALLAISTPAIISVSAFAPGMITSANLAPNSIRMDIENGMVRRDKPAKSQEEDLELTRAIIMKHISISDKGYDDDDDDEDDVNVLQTILAKATSVTVDDNDIVGTDVLVSTASSSSEVGESAPADGEDGDERSTTQERLKKIKSFGIQVKDDLKGRFGRAREVGQSLQPLKNIKSFGTKIKDDLKSRLGKDE